MLKDGGGRRGVGGEFILLVNGDVAESLRSTFAH